MSIVRTPTGFLTGFVASVCLIAPVLGDDGESFFEKQVRPILVKHCYKCHAGTNSRGGLKLDTRAGLLAGGASGSAVVPRKPNESLLIRAVRYDDSELQMPPKDAGGKLSDQQVAAIEKWVRMGAPDPRESVESLGGMSVEDAKSWWAFQPLPKANTAGASAAIDGFLEDKLKSQGARALARADRRTLIRRATFDLTGLPPTADQVDAFVADESEDAFAKLVDRLLDSPQHGVRYGRHWLDVVRYADTAGENSDRPLPHAWRYRNWVIDSFNRDTPFDEFVRLQLAGDVIRGDESGSRRAEGIVATGYLAIARRFGHDIDHNLHLMYEDVIDNLGKSFLGLTTGCARCHDHKYDPITAADYYGLYGIFDSTKFAFPGCEPRGQPKDLVPLLSKAELDAMAQPAQIAAEATRAAKELLGASRALLATSQVGEGKVVSFGNAGEQAKPTEVEVKKGEILLLTVLSNERHGADTTRLVWEIAERDGQRRRWNVQELIPDLTKANPHPGAHGAAWCFFESTADPKFLHTVRNTNGGKAEIQSWSIDDTPSVFVNSSNVDVKVWTTLPAQTFYVHPGPKRPISVAWVLSLIHI